MSELGYYAQIEGGIFGQPDGTDDPVTRAALQEAVIQQQILMANGGAGVPQSYQGHDNSPGQAQVGGPSNLPKPGWTCQNGGGSSPFVTPPDEWSAEGMGQIPDWNDDPNGIGAGSYDMNDVFVGAMAPNPLNRAPIGGGLLQFDDRPNPNTLPQDVGGTEGELDY